MRHVEIAALAFTLIASAAPAFAACQGEMHFQCSIGKKRLEVCQTGSAVTYRFGPAGKPEMEIATAMTDLDYRPWPGIGRAIWESVTFHNDGVSYEVWASLDRLDEAAMPEGGVNVLKGEDLVASLDCNPGSMKAGLDSLYSEKEAAGQCWSFDQKRWMQAPCE